MRLQKKEALAQVLSYEFCEISKNTFLQNTSGRLHIVSCIKSSNHIQVFKFLMLILVAPSTLTCVSSLVLSAISLVSTK